MAPDVSRRAQSFDQPTSSDLVLTGAGCRYRRSADERPSVAVVSAVEGLLDATDGDHDATDGQVLYDSVDPDSLDGIFDGQFTGNVSFTFNGCHVTVTSEEEVLVTRLADLD